MKLVIPIASRRSNSDDNVFHNWLGLADRKHYNLPQRQFWHGITHSWNRHHLPPRLGGVRLAASAHILCCLYRNFPCLRIRKPNPPVYRYGCVGMERPDDSNRMYRSVSDCKGWTSQRVRRPRLLRQEFLGMGQFHLLHWSSSDGVYLRSYRNDYIHGRRGRRPRKRCSQGAELGGTYIHRCRSLLHPSDLLHRKLSPQTRPGRVPTSSTDLS